MPVVFFGHGSPTVIREDNSITRAWQAIARNMPRPKAILAISAHWITRGSAVTAMARPRTIHDFGRGLGADLFSYTYPAPGSPALADRVASLLEPEIKVARDQTWGLDHGTWAVLLKAFPAADIPVVQLSLDGDQPSERHLAIGESLRPLRDEGVLIAASGNIVHNLGTMQWSDEAEPFDWATSFNDRVKQFIVERDAKGLVSPFALGKAARNALPSSEHYVPLLYAYGAATAEDGVRFDPDFVQYKSLSMTSVVWGSSNP